MIECGIPIRSIKKVLNFKLSDVQACISGHGHQDHIRAAKDIMAAGIDLYAPQEALDATDICGHRAHSVEALRQCRIGSWLVMPVPLAHDLPCVGFLLKSSFTGESAVYLCDTQFVNHRFKGSLDIIAIECNYDLGILRSNLESGALGVEAARRTVNNHMSLETVKGFLRATDLSRVREIHLLHLSAGNSSAYHFQREIQEVTGKPTYIAEA